MVLLLLNAADSLIQMCDNYNGQWSTNVFTLERRINDWEMLLLLMLLARTHPLKHASNVLVVVPLKVFFTENYFLWEFYSHGEKKKKLPQGHACQ